MADDTQKTMTWEEYQKVKARGYSDAEIVKKGYVIPTPPASDTVSVQRGDARPGAMPSDATNMQRPDPTQRAENERTNLDAMRTMLPFGRQIEGVIGALHRPIWDPKGMVEGYQEGAQGNREAVERTMGKVGPIGTALLQMPGGIALGAGAGMLGGTAAQVMSSPVLGGAVGGMAFPHPEQNTAGAGLVGAATGKVVEEVVPPLAKAWQWGKRSLFGQPSAEAGMNAIEKSIIRSGQSLDDIRATYDAQITAGQSPKLVDALGDAGPVAVNQASRSGLPDQAAGFASRQARQLESLTGMPNVRTPEVEALYKTAYSAGSVQFDDPVGLNAFRFLQKEFPTAYSRTIEDFNEVVNAAIASGDMQTAVELSQEVQQALKFQAGTSKELSVRFLDKLKQQFQGQIDYLGAGTKAAMNAANAASVVRADDAALKNGVRAFVDGIDDAVMVKMGVPAYKQARELAGTNIETQKLLRQFREDVRKALVSAANRGEIPLPTGNLMMAGAEAAAGMPRSSVANASRGIGGMLSRRAEQKEGLAVLQELFSDDVPGYLAKLSSRKVLADAARKRTSVALSTAGGTMMNKLFGGIGKPPQKKEKEY